MRSLSEDLKRLGTDICGNIGDYYQQVVLGVPRFPQHNHAPEPTNEGPSFGGSRHSTNFFPPKGLDGEILSPEPGQPMPVYEKSPEEIFVELRAMKIEPSTTKGLPAPSPEPDRGGPDFEP